MNINRQTLRRFLGFMIILILIVFLVFHLKDVAGVVAGAFKICTPFLIGAGLAFVLNVPLRFLERRVFTHIKNPRFKRMQRGIGILLSLILVFVIISAVMGLILPQLIDSVTLFASNIPQYMERTEQLLIRLGEKIPDAKPQLDRIIHGMHTMTPEKVQAFILDFFKSNPQGDGQGGSVLTKALSSTVGLVSSIFGILLTAVLGFVFALNILFAKEKLAIQGRRILFAFLGEDNARYAIHVFQVAFAKFYSFLTGQVADATILGVLMVVGMLVLRLPYAVMIGTMVGFTALVPIAGAITGGVVGFLLVLSVSTTKAFIFLAFMLCLQQFESNVIYPRIVGGSVGLPAMWTLFAITIGGSLMGLVGMLIFVPLMSTFYTLFREIVYGRLQMKRISKEDLVIMYGLPDDKRLPY